MDLTPQHNNSINANRHLHWNGTDTYTRWHQNIQDPSKNQFFKDNNWDYETAISYQYNSQGFRCNEFDQIPAYLALGCSFTEGVGLSVEQTWPALLAQQLNQPVLNLGVGGSGLDTCFRLLDYYVGKLNLLGIFVLEPPSNRFELFEIDGPYTYMPHDSNTLSDRNIIYKYWMSSEDNENHNIKKNRYAMQHICDVNNLKLVRFPCTELYSGNFNAAPARDLLHAGPMHNMRISNKFLVEFNKAS